MKNSESIYPDRNSKSWQIFLADYLKKNPSLKKVVDGLSRAEFKLLVDLVKESWSDGWHKGLPY